MANTHDEKQQIRCGCSGSDRDACGPATETCKWKKYMPAIISFVMLVAGIVADNTLAESFFNGWIRLGWYIIAYLPVGLPVLSDAVRSLARRDFFNEFWLMSLATIGAFFIGEYPEAVAVMLFYSIGELFQDAAIDRAQRNINALLDVRPDTATVIRPEGEVTVVPDTVEVGEIIEVKVGERVPLDGILESGAASFNTSALTGESVPRSISEGGEVLAGMIASDKVVRIKTTKPFGESSFARILDMVRNANERKAPAERFIHKFAKIYTPIVVVLAVLIVLLPLGYSALNTGFAYVFDEWLYRALVFLVISCPCALVISIPLGYFGGIGAASRQGILFKGGTYLDTITKIDAVVMDKTGTLTQGVFDVQHISSVNGFTDSELLGFIASAESGSSHPIAKAVTAYATGQGIVFEKPGSIEEVAGHGIAAVLDNKKILAGNLRLLDKYGISYPAELSGIPETIVACAVDGVYSGYILVADSIKPDAKAAVNGMRGEGVSKIVMLSGDKQAIVDKVASELGITEAYGGLLPEGKAEYIQRIKAGSDMVVAFVGDGINDAPVLAASDMGIAMGALGSDVAIETADMVIQTDQLSKIPAAMRIGRITRRIVWQNIWLAFGVKVLVMILGAFGVATLWEAVFADVGVALLAILNAMRIFRMAK